MENFPDGCDPDFVWDDYLEQTDSIAAPATAFVHVEHSLMSSFKLGMNMEVLNSEEGDGSYWVASVVMICGPLLTLRFLGYGEDRSADFWFNLKTCEFHPVGWCEKNGKKLHPPKGVRERYPNFLSLLTPDLALNTVPAFLQNDPDAEVTPIDLIKEDMLVSVLDEFSQNEWPARIIQNVGGRLQLRYEGSPSTGETDFWLFYLSERIRPLNSRSKPLTSYRPPPGKKIDLSENQSREILVRALDEAESFPFPVRILEPQLYAKEHGFKKGMKLEILNPRTFLDIRAATVTKILSSKYFLVEVDQDKEDGPATCFPIVCCHSATQTIFPCNWAKEHGLQVFGPHDNKEADGPCSFEWEKYLASCKAVAVPKDLFEQPNLEDLEFEVGMKLEAINPLLPDQIHAATIEKIVGPLLWIRLDDAKDPKPNHVVPISSFNIFPVGWCASNCYPLQTPAVLNTVPALKVPAKPIVPETKVKVPESSKDSSSRGNFWCPKIYFNHCCFTGPYLSKSRLAELPQTIGPGPVDLVMKDVLTRLINIAYKSSKVLKELQVSGGKSDPDMVQQTIKAKYRGKSYRAIVEFVRNSDQVEEFCRKICRKLECCPHLFGPNRVGKDCPENCYTLTKTKFGHGFLKRQIKPPTSNGATGSDDSPDTKKGPGRRKKRKRKHMRLIDRDIGTIGDNQTENTNTEAEIKPESKEPSVHSSEESEEEKPKKKAKEVPAPTPTESRIVTRGAKLPNYSLALQSWKRKVPSSASLVINKDKDSQSPVVPLVRKRGRPFGSVKKVAVNPVESAKVNETAPSPATHPITSRNLRVLKDAEQIGLPSNPADWTIDDVYKYIKSTPCEPLARLLKAQEIDGQALMMLTLHSVQEFLHLKLEPAKMLCTIVENLKYEFITKFT